jgi:hypothetical protein
MKIIELVNKVSVAITNEEADVLLQFDEDTPTIAKGDLNDRQQILANQLVNKDLLVRIKENGRTIYKKRLR